MRVDQRERSVGGGQSVSSESVAWGPKRWLVGSTEAMKRHRAEPVGMNTGERKESELPRIKTRRTGVPAGGQHRTEKTLATAGLVRESGLTGS